MTDQGRPDVTDSGLVRIRVNPTGPRAKLASDEKEPTGPERHTDISITGLFASHVANINSVRQAIWQRFAAMLVANSFFAGFINASQTEDLLKAFGAWFGIAVGIFWLQMLMTDRAFFNARLEEADRFFWPALGHAANPMSSMIIGTEKEMGRLLFKLAGCIVVVFILLFTFLAHWYTWLAAYVGCKPI